MYDPVRSSKIQWAKHTKPIEWPRKLSHVCNRTYQDGTFLVAIASPGSLEAVCVGGYVPQYDLPVLTAARDDVGIAVAELETINVVRCF
jgi:hypothetical protein